MVTNVTVTILLLVKVSPLFINILNAPEGIGVENIVGTGVGVCVDVGVGVGL